MYQIKLPIFEGPFDLLLFLIQKNEIDIYDIPIARITEEYLAYLEMMKMLDLEIAGEFVEMVATLILIKTRTLLPQQEHDSEEEFVDPRRQLTLQLLQYKRFKEAAESLESFENEQLRYFPRRSQAREMAREKALEDDNFEIDATLFDLMTAFKRALDNMPKITVHTVKTVRVTIEDQAKLIINRLEGNRHASFFEIMKDLPEKVHVLVTFMAILDMMRLGLLSAKQSESFGDIRLVPVGELTHSRYLAVKESAEVAPISDDDSPEEEGPED